MASLAQKNAVQDFSLTVSAIATTSGNPSFTATVQAASWQPEQPAPVKEESWGESHCVISKYEWCIIVEIVVIVIIVVLLLLLICCCCCKSSKPKKGKGSVPPPPPPSQRLQHPSSVNQQQQYPGRNWQQQQRPYSPQQPPQHQYQQPSTGIRPQTTSPTYRDDGLDDILNSAIGQQGMKSLRRREHI